MTPDEARKVAIALADTWPHAGIVPERWVEPLGRLDIDQARATYRAARDTFERAPSVAQFLAKHRELHPPHRNQRHREPCFICDGLGWEHVERQRPGHANPTSGVVPCRCTNGRQHDDMHRRMLDELADLHRQHGHQDEDATRAA